MLSVSQSQISKFLVFLYETYLGNLLVYVQAVFVEILAKWDLSELSGQRFN